MGFLGGLVVLSLTQREACAHIRPQTGGESRAQPKKFNHFFFDTGCEGNRCDKKELGEHPDFISEALIKSSPDKNNLRERRFILAPSSRLRFIITSGFQGQNLDQQMHSQGQRENDAHACMLG